MRGVRRRTRVPRAAGASPSAGRSSSARTVRCAAHGGTKRQRCPTSTSCFRPRGLCRARRRALRRRRGRGDLAGRRARATALPRRRRARATARPRPATTSRRTTTLARRAPARARPRALARPLHVPARVARAPELRRLAVRAPSTGRSSRRRPRGRVERCSCSSPTSAPALPDLRLAARARAPARAGARRRARVRDRAVPGRAERRATCSARSRCCSRSHCSGVETGAPRRWWLAVAGAALASIPLSGQVHLALGAIPFFCCLRACRSAAACCIGRVAAACAAVAARAARAARWSIAGSISAGGRSLAAVALLLGAVARLRAPAASATANESFVFLGWLTPLVALAGLVLLVRNRASGSPPCSASASSSRSLLALGTHLPLYSWLWQHVRPLRYPRVPERLMPIACLSHRRHSSPSRRPRRRTGIDRRCSQSCCSPPTCTSHAYGASAADRGNAAYTALRGSGPGRLLELPVFLPEIHYGSRLLLLRDAGAPAAAGRLLDDRARRGRTISRSASRGSTAATGPESTSLPSASGS